MAWPQNVAAYNLIVNKLQTSLLLLLIVKKDDSSQRELYILKESTKFGNELRSVRIEKENDTVEKLLLRTLKIILR